MLFDRNLHKHNAAEHSVHPTGGTLRVRVFRQFAWLEAGSVKAALSRPTHQRVTQAVGRHTAFECTMRMRITL
jgi:hypothetical protein